MTHYKTLVVQKEEVSPCNPVHSFVMYRMTQHCRVLPYHDKIAVVTLKRLARKEWKLFLFRKQHSWLQANLRML